jgi:hypothetical protein
MLLLVDNPTADYVKQTQHLYESVWLYEDFHTVATRRFRVPEAQSYAGEPLSAIIPTVYYFPFHCDVYRPCPFPRAFLREPLQKGGRAQTFNACVRSSGARQE